MPISKRFLSISKNKTFEHLTSAREKQLSKLTGNLRKLYPCLKSNIFLKENDLVIDCGANVGNITSVFNRFGCIVYSFEPTSSTFEILKKRFSNIEKIKCIQKAVGAANDIKKLYHHEWSEYNKIYWSDGNSLIYEKSNVNNNDYEEVEVIDLVEFINSLDKEIALIKIDIEGAEIELLNHLIDTGTIHKINKIICEVHDRKYPIFKEDTDKLRYKIKHLGLEHKIDLNWM